MYEPEFASKITEDGVAGEQIKLLCSYCKHTTNHLIIKSVRDDYKSDDIGLQGWVEYTVVKCMGCDVISFCKKSSDTETYYEQRDDKGEIIDVVYPVTTEQYPVVSTDFQKNRIYAGMPSEVKEAYEETYIALSYRLPKLAASGARLIIELICLKSKITDGTLQNKIDELHTNGVVTGAMKELLHNVRIFGNLNLHTEKTPDEYELLSAWNAINSLLDAIYGIAESNKNYAARKGVIKAPS